MNVLSDQLRTETLAQRGDRRIASYLAFVVLLLWVIFLLVLKTIEKGGSIPIFH